MINLLAPDVLNSVVTGTTECYPNAGYHHFTFLLCKPHCVRATVDCRTGAAPCGWASRSFYPRFT